MLRQIKNNAQTVTGEWLYLNLWVELRSNALVSFLKENLNEVEAIFEFCFTGGDAGGCMLGGECRSGDIPPVIFREIEEWLFR